MIQSAAPGVTAWFPEWAISNQANDPTEVSMTTDQLELGLRIAGLVLAGLVAANFVAARRWNYRENLAGADAIVRQVFYVHGAYIVGIIAALALLCLGWPRLLLSDGMGRVLSGFFGLFWGSRVLVQLLVYDPGFRRANRGWDLFFLGVFGFLGCIFTLAAWQP